jgi:phosphoglycerate dehydrogenase-like enzyme
MKIVVVDHVYLEDAHIKQLRSMGSLKVYKDPPRTIADLKRRTENADVVIVGWSQMTDEVINSAKKLKMISIWATSCHYADARSAKAKGIVVTHVPHYATEAVAEHAFALMLASARKLLLGDRHVRTGHFDWRPFGGIELRGKTLGIVGTGSIGSRVAELSKPFEMHLLGYDKYPNLKRAKELGIEHVDLQALMKKSDFITLHVILTPETEKLVSEREISAMKKNAIIVNTSQGKVIDEKALAKALKSGRLFYAGLDVFEKEPPDKDNPLFALNNALFTPHVGFHTFEAVKRCSDICVDNVGKFLEGHQQNIC